MKKPSVWHRLRTIDRKMPRRSKLIFSIKLHKRKRENKRLPIEALVLQKLWIAWQNLYQIRTKRCKQNKTKITLHPVWLKMSNRSCKTLIRKGRIAKDMSKLNIFLINKCARKTSLNRAKLEPIGRT